MSEKSVSDLVAEFYSRGGQAAQLDPIKTDYKSLTCRVLKIRPQRTEDNIRYGTYIFVNLAERGEGEKNLPESFGLASSIPHTEDLKVGLVYSF